jgi:hypothetical protein
MVRRETYFSEKYIACIFRVKSKPSHRPKIRKL